MGMHHGLVVFRGTFDMLERAIAERNGKLSNVGTPIDLAELPAESDDGFPSAFCSTENAMVFLDQSMMLGFDPDFATLLAARTGSTVATSLAETVSGTFHFACADPGGLRRAYAHCHMSQTEPWSFGVPLQCETQHPFNGDLDGDAFFAAFAELGFGDLRRLYQQPWTPCLLDFDWNAAAPAKSAVVLERNAFQEAHKLSKPPPLMVVARASTTPPLPQRPVAAPNQGFLHRIRRLFGK